VEIDARLVVQLQLGAGMQGRGQFGDQEEVLLLARIFLGW